MLRRTATSKPHQHTKSYYGQVFVRRLCHRETSHGCLKVAPPSSAKSSWKHSPLDKPANLPKCYLLSALSATFASTSVFDGSVPTVEYVTMPASTSHEATRTTSKLSTYNESLIPHLYEGSTKILQSYLPALC